MFSVRFDAALVFAHNLHHDHLRKTTTIPYVGHLLSVAGVVIEHGGTENEAIAALLHDAVEDRGGKPTLWLIASRFGDEVARIVSECSDTDVTPKPPWKERKETYINHLPSASPSAWLVSAADKLCNARSTILDYHASGDRTFEKFKGGKEGTLWYYRALVTKYRECPLMPNTIPVVDELDRTWRLIETFVAIKDAPGEG